jgi:hypothetical protein
VRVQLSAADITTLKTLMVNGQKTPLEVKQGAVTIQAAVCDVRWELRSDATTRLKADDASSTQRVAAVAALVTRRAPLLSPFLELRLEERKEHGAVAGAPEFFHVTNSSSSPHNISVVANSPSALALGVHYYIKYVALRQIAWGTSNLDTITVPPPRPTVPNSERHTVSATWRYAWNVCTHGYTMPWWDWERWMLELDFMSLQGSTCRFCSQARNLRWQRPLGAWASASPSSCRFFLDLLSCRGSECEDNNARSFVLQPRGLS